MCLCVCFWGVEDGFGNGHYFVFYCGITVLYEYNGTIFISILEGLLCAGKYSYRNKCRAKDG